MTNLEKYNQVFVDILGVEESQLDESFTFKKVDAWDSVVHITLISELEDVFDIMFSSDEILNYGSYLNGITILKRYGIEF